MVMVIVMGAVMAKWLRVLIVTVNNGGDGDGDGDGDGVGDGVGDGNNTLYLSSEESIQFWRLLYPSIYQSGLRACSAHPSRICCTTLV